MKHNDSRSLAMLQAIAFEISVGCPLSKLHSGICPISDKHRWDKLDTSRPMSDELIIDSCETAYHQLGFRGWITWHNFNEPMLEFDRIENLILQLRERISTFRTEVSTNGEVLPDDLKRMKCFDRIRLKNYTGRDQSALLASHPNVEHDATPFLDERMASPVIQNQHRCRRMYDELPIDFYGNGHICAGDWQGNVPIGNIWDDGIEDVAERFLAVRDQIGQEPVAPDAPEYCRNCGLSMRYGDCIIDQEIFEEITQKRGY